MKSDNLKSFLDALHRRDFARVEAGLADHATLKSPIIAEPFVGKQKVIFVLQHLICAVDEFNAVEILEGTDHFAVFLKIRVGSTVVEGVDDMRLNSDGLVESMRVMWRPLPGVVLVQNRLAASLGIPALSLVPGEVPVRARPSTASPVT